MSASGCGPVLKEIRPKPGFTSASTLLVTMRLAFTVAGGSPSMKSLDALRRIAVK